MATPSGSRLRYTTFRGSKKEDPDAFLRNFLHTAAANRETTETDKLRFFSTSSSSEDDLSDNDSDSEEEKAKDRSRKKEKKKKPSRHVSSSDFDSESSPSDDRRMQKKKSASSNKSDKAETAKVRKEKHKKKSRKSSSTSSSSEDDPNDNDSDSEKERMSWYCRRGPQAQVVDVIVSAETYETSRETAKVRKEKHKKKSRKSSSTSSSSEDDLSDNDSDSEEEKAKDRSRKKEKKKKPSRHVSSSDSDSESSRGDDRRMQKKKSASSNKSDKAKTAKVRKEKHKKKSRKSSSTSSSSEDDPSDNDSNSEKEKTKDRSRKKEKKKKLFRHVFSSDSDSESRPGDDRRMQKKKSASSSKSDKAETAKVRKEKHKKKSRKSYSTSSSSEDDPSDNDSDSEEEKTKDRSRKKEKKKKPSRHVSSSDSDSESSLGDDRRMQKKKSASSSKSNKAEKNSFDQLVKKMTELTVQWAGPKEKRKDAKALKYELWCSTCHNQGHTKEDCRLPMANTTANTHWIGESSFTSAEDYYAEGADGHVYHVSMTGAQPSGPRSRGGKLDGASSSSSHHDMSSFQINSSLYQLYAPEPPLKADIDIFFFHGLLLGDPLDHVAHTTTWRSLDKKEEIWPKCWLPSDYSLARVITVAYDAYTKTSMTRGRMDLHLIGESLLSDIILERKIEGSLRPLVLVGHCFGGLVIKQVCLHAKRSLKDERLNNMFLSNIKGICFYSTPHHGMEGLDHLVKHGSPLANLIHALNTESARLHESFDELWRFKFRHWDIISICETQPSDERSSVLVPEGSSRYGTCIPVAANHFTVCRPIDKQSTNYQLLIKLVTDCSVKGKITQALEVPEIIVGRESAIDDAMETLQKHAFICFSGTGGVGKTTTAKILFNRLCAQFDFTCFLSDVKLRGNTDEIREKAKRSIRCEGREVEHLKWDEVRGSKLLLVFDDISKDDHLKLLKELAKDNGNPDSRFIATSRDGDCVRLFERAEKIHVQIQSLDILGYEDASRLFMFYIGLKPKNVTENTVKQIVQACDGLPLLLEVMGKYLGGVQEKKIWMSVPAILHSWDNVMPLEEAVWKKLQISFDNLGSEEQEMFLDVATCFSGIRWRDWLERLGFGEHSDFVGDHWKRIVETAMTAWGSRHRGAEVRLNTLVDRSLVQIRTEGTERVFSMHEHLRAMGQRIAREKSRNVTWPPAEADLPLLRQHRDKKAGNRRFCCWGRALPQLDVQYVRVPATIEASINQHPSGTILFCDHCKVSGIQLPAETTTLLWERTSKQAVVSLPTGVFRVTWKEPIMPRRPQEIKIIQDEGFREICEELVVLELSGHDDSDAESILWVNARISLRNLESLTLHYCRLEQSSGSWLQRCLKLRRLSVISCCRGVQFLHLVKTVGQLTNLEQLKITEKKDTDPFSDVVEFTQQLSTNEVLEIVEIEDTDSLDLGRYELQSDFFMLPDSFGNMSSLTHLSLESKLHRALPKSFGNLENLSKLSLSCPSLQTLPDSFGDLGCLSSLDLLSDELQKLPSSFESLTSLKSLRLKCSKLQRLPESLLNLTHLEELHFHECKKLEVLPGWIWDLGNLRKLKFPVCGDLRKVPDSLRRLIHLETLWCSFPVGSAASSEQEREDLRESVQEFGKLSQPLLADLSFRKRFAYEIKFRSVLWFERRSKDFTDLELEQKQENFVASLERMKYIRTW